MPSGKRASGDGRERPVLDLQEPLDADGAGGSAPSSHASLPTSSDKLRLAERRHPPPPPPPPLSY